MTCRDEILAVIQELVQDRPDGIFSLSEVMRIMHQRQSPYLLSTVARNVTTVMCVSAPKDVSRHHDDLERVSRGRYRLSSAYLSHEVTRHPVGAEVSPDLESPCTVQH